MFRGTGKATAVACQGDDLDVLEIWLFPQQIDQFDAVHLRHTDVGENDPRFFGKSFIKAFFAVFRLNDFITLKAKEKSQAIATIKIIFNNQYFHIYSPGIKIPILKKIELSSIKITSGRIE